MVVQNKDQGIPTQISMHQPNYSPGYSLFQLAALQLLSVLLREVQLLKVLLPEVLQTLHHNRL